MQWLLSDLAVEGPALRHSLMGPGSEGPAPTPLASSCCPVPPRQGRGADAWVQPRLLTCPDSSSRLSAVSHGNTIALFFRSLLPSYTTEVCRARSHTLPVASGRALVLLRELGVPD